MKNITYALLFVAMDTVPTTLLWIASPTDTVRVWYPTLLSFVGEHLVASAITLVLVWWVLRATRLMTPNPDGGRYGGSSLKPIGMLFLGLLYAIADVCASIELALIQSAAGGSIKLWHTRRLTDYLSAREPVYAVFAVVVLAATIVRLRAGRAGGRPFHTSQT